MRDEMGGRLLKYGLPWVAAAMVVIHGGCLGYRLGSTLPPGISSAHIPAFVNRTREPLLERETTKAAIQEFHKDGTLRVTDADRADAIVKVTLTDYGLEPLRYDRDRAKLTKEYRMTIKAEVVFMRVATGEVLLKRKVEGESTFEPTGDLSSAKRVALPKAAGDLAHDIVECVVEYW